MPRIGAAICEHIGHYQTAKAKTASNPDASSNCWVIVCSVCCRRVQANHPHCSPRVPAARQHVSVRTAARKRGGSDHLPEAFRNRPGCERTGIRRRVGFADPETVKAESDANAESELSSGDLPQIVFSEFASLSFQCSAQPVNSRRSNETSCIRRRDSCDMKQVLCCSGPEDLSPSAENHHPLRLRCIGSNVGSCEKARPAECQSGFISGQVQC